MWSTAFALGVSLLLSSTTSAQETSLFITSSSPHDGHLPQCMTDSYYGSYGRPLMYAYALSASCADQVPLSFDSGSMVQLDAKAGAGELIWLQDAGVDDSLRGSRSFQTELDDLVKTAEELSLSGTNPPDQAVLGSPTRSAGLTIIYRTSTSAIISAEPAFLNNLDMILPAFISPIALPLEPRAAVPIPKTSIKRVQGLLKGLKFSPDIASILSTFSVGAMRADIRHLTGEDGLGILSRHSFSSGALVAADWIQEKFEATGAKCRQSPFLPGYAPNVICRYDAITDTTALVLLSAHYDSRGSFGSTRAPGGNDDGSGVTHLLAIAQAIKSNGIKFKSNVELVAFAGEEQGLRGSHAYARELNDLQANITLMIQADMLAYHSPSEPLQLGLPDLIGLPEAAWLVGNVSKIYSPELTVGSTPACCSDHQSFHEEGFPATQVYERAGPIIDPKYHNSGDLSDRVGYDLQQVRSIAKVTFASVLEAAGFELPRV